MAVIPSLFLFCILLLSDHPEASEEGEKGQEETAGGAGVRVQAEGAGGADPEAAVALRQHALAQRSDPLSALLSHKQR